jgi:hypothetical protein
MGGGVEEARLVLRGQAVLVDDTAEATPSPRGPAALRRSQTCLGCRLRRKHRHLPRPPRPVCGGAEVCQGDLDNCVADLGGIGDLYLRFPDL